MECTLRRILREVVVSSKLGLLQLGWIFFQASPTPVKYLPSTGVYVHRVHWGETCSYPRFVWSCRYVLIPYGRILGWIFDALAFLCRNASIDSWRVSHVSGSKSVPSGNRFKRSSGVCLSPSYTGDWLFTKSHCLAILSNSIEPWPMTLAPTNETIRRETMRKKRPKG